MIAWSDFLFHHFSTNIKFYAGTYESTETDFETYDKTNTGHSGQPPDIHCCIRQISLFSLSETDVSKANKYKVKATNDKAKAKIINEKVKSSPLRTTNYVYDITNTTALLLYSTTPIMMLYHVLVNSMSEYSSNVLVLSCHS